MIPISISTSGKIVCRYRLFVVAFNASSERHWKKVDWKKVVKKRFIPGLLFAIIALAALALGILSPGAAYGEETKKQAGMVPSKN
jgi:hypothetical protein